MGRVEKEPNCHEPPSPFEHPKVSGGLRSMETQSQQGEETSLEPHTRGTPCLSKKLGCKVAAR
jgi:hypothetical protein